MVLLDPGQLSTLIKNQPPFAGCKGSVVRLRVSDFMTYHFAELRAGAHVNLILGPNGTGKSTIVCAICLGLAGKPKYLGRANALKEYIRHGAKSATIEIELFNPDGRNYVIKRYIKDQGKAVQTTWYLDGKKVKPEVIEELTSSLNIQLDNLCQFLPQDRVQDFVGMDSFTLLQNTQKAHGNDALYQRHENLIRLTQTLQEIEKNLKGHATQLKSATQYTKRLEKDVENFREREQLLAKISDLNAKKAWMSYVKARDVFANFKNQLEEFKAKKMVEEGKLAPMRKSVTLLETKLQKLRGEVNRIRNSNASIVNGLKRKVEEENDKVDSLVSDEQAKFEELERSENDRLCRVNNIKTKIAGLEKQLEACRMKGDMDDDRLKGEMKEAENVIQRLENAIFEITSEDERDESNRRLLSNKIRRAEQDLRVIDDLRVSRMKYLEAEQRDVADTVRYFSDPENRKRFKGEIHEPMILHIAVNDLKFGRVLERHVGFAEMNGFFCENRDDVEVMLDINEKRGKRVSVTHYEGPRNGVYKKPAPQYPPEFMRQWGFVKVLLDLIEAPDYYLSYLHDRWHLEKILIGSEKSESLYQDIAENTALNLFYTEKSAYSFRQSHYSKSKVLSYNPLQIARVMTTEINANEKQRLNESVLEWKAQDKQLEAQIRGRGVEKARLDDERSKKEDMIRDIKARIDYTIGTQRKLEMARKNHLQLERESKDLEGMRKKTQEIIGGHKRKLVNVCDLVSRECSRVVQPAIMAALTRKQISLIQVKLVARQTELEQMRGDVKQCEASIATLEPQVKKAASDAEQAKREAMTQSPNSSEPPQDVLSGELTEKELDKELNQATVQLRFLMVTDPGIVRDYQDKMRQIKDLQKDHDADEKRLADLKEEIETEKEAWLTPLNELIETVDNNFGRFFSNMGCAGKVQLFVDGDGNDFSKYGIKILVKFRSSENLSELGGTKGCALQSGGERVISTALYILALQELTTVPFRVIDEINQGMDATNEARFFNLLCSLAKGPNTPQYFLLTPKMLPPVDYPDNVDFHLIMSGPYVDVPLSDTANTVDDTDDDDDM